MPGRNFLFVPGPTNVPDRVLRAMHVAMEDHRSSSFPALTKPLLRERSGIEVATYAMVAGTVMSLPFLPWGWHDIVATPLSAWA